MATLEELQKRIDDNTIDPENFSAEQKEVFDAAIEQGLLKGSKSDEIIANRTEAATNIARKRQIEADPLKALREAEGSSFFSVKDRAGAELVGDIIGSILPLITMRKGILKAARGGQLLNKQTLTFGRAAQMIPDELKFTKGVLSRVARLGDIPERIIRSPLGQMELASIAGGSVGAGLGSIAYDVANESIGDEIVASLTEDLGAIPQNKIDQDISLNAWEAVKNAAMWNAGAAAITPIITGPLGKLFANLVGVKGARAKELAQFARDTGAPIPLITAMDRGFFGNLMAKYFKTVGVFPGISGVGRQALEASEQVMGKEYIQNLTSYAPLVRTSVLGHSILDQMNKVYRDKMSLITAAYKQFDAAAVAGKNAGVVSLDNTRRIANEMVESLEQYYPRIREGLDTADFKNIDMLTMRGDPLNSFYKFVKATGKDNISVKQFKGMMEMLNNAMENTRLAVPNIQIKAIREAAELDLASMGNNLNKNALLRDAGIKQQYEAAGGAVFNEAGDLVKFNEAAGDAFIKTIIDGNTIAVDKLTKAHETYSKIMSLYTKYGLTSKLAKVDKKLFTAQALAGITGRADISRDAFFKEVEKSVFLSGDPGAIKNFKQLVGYTADPSIGMKLNPNGKFVFDTAMNRYFFNTFLSSFDTAVTPGAKSIFNAIDNNPLIRNSAEYADDFLRSEARNPIYRDTGFTVQDVRRGVGNVNVTEIRFSPEDFAQFNINKFMNKLGIGEATEDLGRDKLLQMMSPKHYEDFIRFTDYMKAISDVPLSDSSTFLQRRFMLGSLGSIAGGLVIGAGAFAVNPFAPLIFMGLARQFGKVISDPVALRLLNDALLPEEMEAIAKTGKLAVKGYDKPLTIKSGQYRRLTPDAMKLGFNKKRDAAARFLNYLFPEEKDNPQLDLNKVSPKEIADYLSNKPYVVPNDNEIEQKMPKEVIDGMFVNEKVTVKNEDDIVQNEDFYRAAVNAEEQTMKDINSDNSPVAEQIDTDMQLAQAYGQTPQAPAQPQMPQSQMAQALFPQDELLQLALQRKESGNA